VALRLTAQERTVPVRRVGGHRREVISLRETARRILGDLKNRRQLEAYVVAAVALVLAVLSIVEGAVPENFKWAVLFLGLGLLVYQVTVPERGGGTADDILSDRSAFDQVPLADRVRSAQEIWIFAPSAANVLSPRTCEALRTGMLARADGVVRVVVLDPRYEDRVQLAVRQLDDSLEYPVQQFRQALEATIHQLERMASWPVSGTVEYRFIDYNPGFSLVAINPGRRDGVVIVEFHGFHNEATHSRMHVELRRSDSERWYSYWLDQFGAIWAAARPAAPASPASG
jgi:hypothetical protein